jgi:hypothetical protein
MTPRLFNVKLPDGQDSAPFDSGALIAYVQSGHIGPGTWVFDVSQNRWLTAGEIDVAKPYMQSGSLHGYPPVLARSTGKTSKAVVTSAIAGLAVLIFVAFLTLKPLFLKLSDAGPGQVITTSDGLYEVTYPSSWHKHFETNGTAVNYTNIGDTVAVRMNRLRHATHANAGRLPTILKAMTNAMVSKENCTLVGSQQPTTLDGYPAVYQELTMQKDFQTLDFHVYLVDAPNALYDVTGVAVEGDTDGNDKADKIIRSFRTAK